MGALDFVHNADPIIATSLPQTPSRYKREIMDKSVGNRERREGMERRERVGRKRKVRQRYGKGAKGKSWERGGDLTWIFVQRSPRIFTLLLCSGTDEFKI